jgi:hypothetical protein
LIGDAPGAHTGAELAANNPYCQLIQREYLPAQQLVFAADRKFSAQYVNLGGIKTKGLDVQLDWASRFADVGLSAVPGTLTANITYSHLDSYAQSPFEGGAFVEQKGTGVNFEYRIFTTLGYSNGPWWRRSARPIRSTTTHWDRASHPTTRSGGASFWG